ncbi:MAG: fibronectin type III domain-containing protein [Gallionella sp.]|nr:fibronectin type III domain-containing protein [Gallionella sp.]
MFNKTWTFALSGWLVALAPSLVFAADVLPSSPTSVTATAGNGSATVSFTPGSIGSGTLITYWAACGVDTSHLIQAAGSSSPITVTGLTNGTVYYCWAIAETTVGYSSHWSTVSNPVTPTSVAPVLPSAPTNVTATVGDGSATVTFTPGSIGSGTLVSYWAACDIVDDTTTGNAIYASGSSSPITVTGLTNGTAYSCGALARSTVGDSPWSVRANPVTPVSAQAASAMVIEFYNTNLDHYFITADSGEAAAIDSGSAGPGWSRTGNTFNASGSTPVCRFYGSQSPGPNSHFYTADAGECAYLKQLQASTPATQKRWNFESLDFLTTVTVNGTCPAGTTPVYRAYNNGSTRGVDSNHRITANLTAILQQEACGWKNEGVVMCASSGTVSGGTTSCGGSGSVTSVEVTVTPSENAQTITVNGVSVTIPGGVLSSATQLTVTTPSSKAAQLPATSKDAKILRSYDISLGDLVSFGQVLTLEFPYDSVDSGPDGDNLWISSLDEQKSQWVTENATVDSARKVVVVRADHLSTWIQYTYPDYLSVGQSYNHFKVFYNPNHTQPRTDKSGGYTMRDLASDTLDALEAARAAYVGANFKPPLQSTVGVVITDNPGGSEFEMHGCIILDRAALTSLTNLRGDTAHELFHVIQNRYFMIKSMMEKQWWIEGTPDYAAATIAWSGVLSIDGLDSNYFETSLLSDNKEHAYQLAQFIRYLVTARGADFKAMWDFVAAQEPYTVVMAFQQTIGNAFPAFRDYVENVTGKTFSQVWADYVDYAMFGKSGLMADVVNTPLKLSGTTTSDSKTVSVQSYAAKVVNVSTDSSASTRSIKLSAAGLESGITVEIWQLANGDRTTAALKSVLVQDSDSAPFDLGANDSLYAVVINTASADRSVTVTVTGTPNQNTYTSTYNGARLSSAGYTGDLKITIDGTAPFTVFSDDRSIGLWMIWLHSPRTQGLAQSYRACIDVSNISSPEKFEITGYYWGEEFMGGTNRTEGNCVDISVTDSSPAFVDRDAYIEFCYINKSSKSCGSYGIADISISDSK